MSFWSRIERRIEEFAGDLIPDEFQERVNEARQQLRGGDYQAAEIALTLLASKRPEHEATQVLLGMARLRLKMPAEAIVAFDAALARRGDLPEASLGRGEASLSMGLHEEAMPFFRTAIDTARGDRELLADAYRGLGACYRRSGDLPKAVREFRKAVAEASTDATSIAALGEALTADPTQSNNEARRHLERLANRDGCPSVAWVALGRIAIDDGDTGRALEYFELATGQDDERSVLADAYAGIGEVALLELDGAAAREAFEAALVYTSRDAALAGKLAQAMALSGETDAAMRQFEKSLAMRTDVKVARNALQLALCSGATEAGVAMANIVLGVDAGDPNALTARGRQLLQQGNLDAALATYQQALSRGEALEPLLAMGELELTRKQESGPDSTASSYARRALRKQPACARAKALLAESQAARLGVTLQEQSSWYDLAAATGRLCTEHPALAELLRDAITASSEFDQPLLVAVMGEFSSGKSTFVNAFVGDDVAPTGITPTTATVNIIKYGRKRGGRVVYRDNTSRELDSSELRDALSSIDDNEARRVLHVEILMPIEVLERVNIVDTPGLNSILPEHEAVARGFLQRADAVIWLFTSNQAGKSSERKALNSISDQGVRVLGVLNKIDQLAGDQVDEIISYVNQELAEWVETCVPISARKALEEKDDSGWQNMRDELETRFFQHARQLKRQALNRRLTTLLSTAMTIAESSRSKSKARAALLRSAAERARGQQLQFIETFVQRERASISEAAGKLYHDAAAEVLELVQPRTMPFGSNRAEPADRDYLLGLLDSRYEALLDESYLRTEAALRQATLQVFEASADQLSSSRHELDALVEEGMRLTQAQVFGRCTSFLRGYLRGGSVDRFFEKALPKIELGESAIYEALFRAAPDIDAEIAVPLASAGGLLLATLADRLDELADLCEVEDFDADAGLEAAVAELTRHRLRLEAQT